MLNVWEGALFANTVAQTQQMCRFYWLHRQQSGLPQSSVRRKIG